MLKPQCQRTKVFLPFGKRKSQLQSVLKKDSQLNEFIWNKLLKSQRTQFCLILPFQDLRETSWQPRGLEGFQNGSYQYNCHSAVANAQLSVSKSLHISTIGLVVSLREMPSGQQSCCMGRAKVISLLMQSFINSVSLVQARVLTITECFTFLVFIFSVFLRNHWQRGMLCT